MTIFSRAISKQINILKHHLQYGFGRKKLVIRKKGSKVIERSFIDAKIKKFKAFGLKDDGPSGIIISLTSYPARISSVHYTLFSLLNQTLKPEKLILWLVPEDFPQKENELPANVLKLTENGLEIKWTHNLRSYNKLVPTARMFPEHTIVTADDDVFYSENWLELLQAEYLRTPMGKREKLVYAHRVRRMRFDAKGNLLPYDSWPSNPLECAEASFLNLATGVGGVLYPPHVLHPDALKEELFLKLAPQADDLFLWAMAVLNGAKIKLVQNPLGHPAEWAQDRSNESPLLQHNVLQGGNDRQLAAIFDHYKELTSIVKPQAELVNGLF